MRRFNHLSEIFPLLVILILALPGFVGAGISVPLSPINTPVQPMYADLDKYAQIDDTSSANQGDQPPIVKPKSMTKAILLSFLLPGAGHFYLGEKGRGEVFAGGEVVSWAGFIGFRMYGDWKEDDYIKYAVEHADIDPSGKDEEFYKNLTFYDSRDEYNEAGRLYDYGPFYPADRSHYWQWDGDDSRDQYRDIRNASKSAYRKATFMIGVAVVNRIIAGIDSFRLAKRLADRARSGYGAADGTKVKFSVNPFSRDPGFKVTISHRF
ncbi:MAG: hypothetical protein JSU69_05135 [Candidatus Zixiibacteriota bacterium]|nr:MAG: hypothetical protein JSU69_05135 [candidate division Zixibacteria bacterium]